MKSPAILKRCCLKARYENVSAKMVTAVPNESYLSPRLTVAISCCHLLPPPIRPANSTARVQRVSDRYTQGLQSHTTACHTPRHWFRIRTNCSNMSGNTTRFSILFNCSENGSSFLGCIITIICSASISNHQIRQISNRHAIKRVTT